MGKKGAKRGPYKKTRERQAAEAEAAAAGPIVSAVCEYCGVNAPARQDNHKPMQHYDGRVKDAWKTQTYCSGKH